MAGDVEEQQDLAADAAFDAGFSDEPSTVTPPVVDDEQAQPQTAEAATAPVPEFVQLTKEEYEQFRAGLSSVDEIRTTTQSQFNKAFGTIGGLKQSIDRIAQSGPVELSAEHFAELEADFGPELANTLRTSLQKALSQGRPSASALQEPEQPQVQEPSRLEVIQAQLTDSRLDEVVDGDWRKEVSTDAFKQWMAKQADDVKSLAESENVRDAARMLRLYVKDKSKPATPTPPPKPSQRQRVLQAAVNPASRAVPASAPAQDDPFDQGFKAVRG